MVQVKNSKRQIMQLKQKRHLTLESHLMPFIVRTTSKVRIDVGITRNIIFLTPPRELRTQTKEIILKNCKYLGRFVLTEADTKQFQAMYPGFCFAFLEKFVRPPQIRDIDFFGREDIHLIPRTEYNKIPLTKYPLMNFFIQNNRYTKWFKNDYNVFYSPSVVNIPESLTKCEELFNYNVLPIKKLVKDIGDLNNLTIKETKNFFLYDDSNLISNTFFTELNKKIQAYGNILLLYNNSHGRLITSKNRLKINVLVDIENDFLTLQLEDILTPKKIETTDSKLKKLSILATGKMNRKIINQVIIEGLQDFEQYMKKNPINIEISDSEIQTKLLFYSKNYKYRFTANSLLFSSAFKEDTEAIFITTNGLNDAKDILIKGKLFQGIGVIYISETENCDKIKNESHWTNVTLTDSELPIAAKHFRFAFETVGLHNLLNFEYSLVTDKGKLLEFAGREDKVPTLNFTIQII